MRRGVNRADAMDTISAAVASVASLENRVPRDSFQVHKRRWGNFWSLYWCFGSHKNNHRIGHAVLLPETAAAGADTATYGHPFRPPSIVLPFAAPPSSPASFLPSEPPSATQSPTGLLSLTSVSANMYSPTSIFAIGPYAHETQLLSPPVFSTFTTEPSTAPCTPPPESIQLTTPSSPEVPFSCLLEPKLQNDEDDQGYPMSLYEFQSYQLQPGSPVSHLISPCSGISGSGTTSPFPDHEFVKWHPFSLEFRTGNPPKLLDLDKIVRWGWKSWQGSEPVTPDAAGTRSCDSCILQRQYSDVDALSNTNVRLKNDDTGVHKQDFEMTPGERLKFVQEKQVASSSAVTGCVENAEHRGEDNSIKLARRIYGCVGNAEHTGEDKSIKIDGSAAEAFISTSAEAQTDFENELHDHKIRTITLGSSKEFNFDTVDGEHRREPRIESEWKANEHIHGQEGALSEDWSFFPVMQTGIL